MDLVPAPGGETPVKTPMVEVEAVDVAEPANTETVALEEALSEFGTDSDNSDGDDALSEDGVIIEFLRDDQLQDGKFSSNKGLLGGRVAPPTPGHPRYPELTIKRKTLILSPWYSSRCLHPRGGSGLPEAPA